MVNIGVRVVCNCEGEDDYDFVFVCSIAMRLHKSDFYLILHGELIFDLVFDP